jgi:hypothetical protein
MEEQQDCGSIANAFTARTLWRKENNQKSPLRLNEFPTALIPDLFQLPPQSPVGWA